MMSSVAVPTAGAGKVSPQDAGRYKDFLTPAQKAALEETAAKVATFGKGITACDEGPGTIGDRFEKVGIVNTEENRRWAPAPASVAFLVLFRAARGAARRFLAAGYMGQASGADSV